MDRFQARRLAHRDPKSSSPTMSLSWMNSSNWVRLRIRMHGCAAARARNSNGSRWSWLMRWPHSAQG